MSRKKTLNTEELNSCLDKNMANKYLKLIGTSASPDITLFKEYQKRCDKLFNYVKDDYIINPENKPRYFQDQILPIEKEIKEMEAEKNQETENLKSELEGYIDQAILNNESMSKKEEEHYNSIKTQLEPTIKTNLNLLNNVEDVENYLMELAEKYKDNPTALKFITNNMFLFMERITSLGGNVNKSKRIFDKVRDISTPEKTKTLRKIKAELSNHMPTARTSRLMKLYREKKSKELQSMAQQNEENKRQEEISKRKEEEFKHQFLKRQYQLKQEGKGIL